MPSEGFARARKEFPMPARRSATPLIFTTLVIAAFMGVTVLGCSHGTARAQPVAAASR